MPDITRPAAERQWMLLALIVLIGINLRPFLTAPGPLLAGIVADTGMGYTALAMMTLLPMLLMGIGAFVVPAIQSAVGVRRGTVAALALLTAGSLARLIVPDGLSLILTAALCGVGVAFIQATVPGIIKAKFPANTPTVTGLYSSMLMCGGALGARVSPMLVDHGLGWRAALAWLALPAAVAFCAAPRVLSDIKVERPTPHLTGVLLRRPRSWMLMAAFGLVNAGYSSIVAWLAPYYQALGWSRADSGNLVVVMAICQAASALALPMLARGHIDRRGWLCLTIAMQAIGFAGLAFLPAAMPIFWVGICGAGLGGSFSLAIVTALDHLPRPEQAGVLVALMQGGGFLIASFGPFATAFLHGLTGSFASGWIMHVVCVTLVLLIYLCLDPSKFSEAMRLGPISSQPLCE